MTKQLPATFVRDAEFGHDRTFRYELTRRWGDDPREVAWIMLNPSLADEKSDDATVRRVVGYSKLWGYDACRVVNLYAFVATEPADLKSAGYPIGPSNRTYIVGAIVNCQLIVAAWGANAPPARAQEVCEMLKRVPEKCVALKILKNKQPAHPVRLGYNRKPVPFP